MSRSGVMKTDEEVNGRAADEDTNAGVFGVAGVNAAAAPAETAVAGAAEASEARARLKYGGLLGAIEAVSETGDDSTDAAEADDNEADDDENDNKVEAG